MRHNTTQKTLALVPAALLFASPIMGVCEQKPFNVNDLAQGTTEPTQIVFTDSESAVLRADTSRSAIEVMAAGDRLVRPLGICQGSSGELFVSDTGCLGIIGIDPQTGSQRVVAHGEALGMPLGLAAERSGTLLVANGQAVLRVNPATGESSLVTSGRFLNQPIAVAVAENGMIYVADAFGAIVQVDPSTGGQRPVTRAQYLIRPQGIAVRGSDLYVTDVATSDGNFGIGRIVHVNLNNRRQRVVSEGRNLVGPVGIAIEESGDLIVGDPYTINEASPDLFDGAILRVNASTGAQALIARGKEGFVNPRCVALVRTSAMSMIETATTEVVME